MSRIEEIKARVEAATPGPWWGDHANYCVVQAHRAHDDNPETVADNVYAEDIDFIAHAREDIPYLLAQLATLEARVERALEFTRALGVTRPVYDTSIRSGLLAILEGDTE